MATNADTTPNLTLDDVRLMGDPVFAAIAADAELAAAGAMTVYLLFAEQADVIGTIRAEQKYRARQARQGQ